ncbi:MAG: prepilin-type N-terminal cleavage/methylation domain-containing protein [Desulfopila sp.]|jgi:general secretion pathway protein G|nr:prepilin-type N-terminal cleavage/methylation domain-containing protein [Desulfopila sp.]
MCEPIWGKTHSSYIKGFTLLELMIVIAILAVLAAIAIPQYKSYTDRARHSQVLQTMRMIEREITVFQLLHNRFPTDLIEAGVGVLRDPWGNPYQYLNIETVVGLGQVRKNRNLVPVNEDYDLYSMGPDGQSRPPFTARASRDDIVRANNGTFLGRVSEY